MGPLSTVDPCEFAAAIPHSPQPPNLAAGNTRVGDAMVIRQQFSFNEVRQVLGGLLEQDLHAKRVDSLCNATLGVLHNASLAVCTIGQGLAAARNLKPKHAIKQVDRLLSNPAINVDDYSRPLGALHHRRANLHRGGTGLDRLRCRQPGHHHVVADQRSRSFHTPGLADRRQGHTQGPPQPLRASRAGTAGRTAAGGDQSVRRRRPRLRRSKTLPDADRRAVFRLRHPLPRQHRRHRHDRRNPHRCRLGASRRTRTRAARRRGHRRSLSGGNRGLCAGHRHEASLVPGRQQHRCHRQATDRILRPSLGHRVRAAR